MLLVRQIMRSGPRGWFVARIIVSIVLVVAVFVSAIHYLKPGENIPVLSVLVVAGVASAYLHWRIDGK